MSKPLLIAHRGDTKNYPENTIQAFQSAIEKGADGFELDVQLDENGVPIVVHNFIYDKTAKYPLLSEVLEKFAGKCRIELEIKALQKDAVKKIAKVIEKYRPLDLEVTSSIQPLFYQVAKYFSNDKRGFIFKPWMIEDWMPKDFKIHWIIQHLKMAKTTVLHLDLELYTQELVKVLHGEHFIAHTHLNKSSKSVLNKVQELGIDQCTFDDIGIVELR